MEYSFKLTRSEADQSLEFFRSQTKEGQIIDGILKSNCTLIIILFAFIVGVWFPYIGKSLGFVIVIFGTLWLQKYGVPRALLKRFLRIDITEPINVKLEDGKILVKSGSKTWGCDVRSLSQAERYQDIIVLRCSATIIIPKSVVSDPAGIEKLLSDVRESKSGSVSQKSGTA